MAYFLIFILIIPVLRQCFGLKRLINPDHCKSSLCPPEENYELWQKLCNYNCPEGERYVCMENGAGKQITEFCAPTLQCKPGTKGEFIIDRDDPTKIDMKVISCPPDRYQSYKSDCINACQWRRNDFTGLPDIFMVYSNGSSVMPPQVYCNYTAGYYSAENKFLFPFDNTFIESFGSYCTHVNKSDPCMKGEVPLPNGTCVVPCHVGLVRDDHDGFICKPQSFSSGGSSLTTQPTSVFHSTTEVKKHKSLSTMYVIIAVIIGVIIAGVFVGVLVVVLCCLCRRKHRKTQNKEGHEENGVETTPLQEVTRTEGEQSETEEESPNNKRTKANGTSFAQQSGRQILRGTDVTSQKSGTVSNGLEVLKQRECPIPNGKDIQTNTRGTIPNGFSTLQKREIPNSNEMGAVHMTEGNIPNETDAMSKKGIMDFQEERPNKSKISEAGDLKKSHNDTLCTAKWDTLNSQTQSVGSLLCKDGIAGTVFRVGENHVMTALHVVYCIIKKDKKGPNQDWNLDWSQLTSECVYVNFNDLITDKPRRVSKLKCVYWNNELDVAVLEFKNDKDVHCFPRKMMLDKSSHLNPERVHVIGFGHPENNLKKHIDPSCEVIPSSSDKIRNAHAWLQDEGRMFRNKVDKDHFDYGYQGYDDLHKLNISCYLEKGASGSPILAFDNDHCVKVVGMLTHGMPDFFFKLSKGDQERFPREYRFEYGTLMRNIYEDMIEKDSNLTEEIFGIAGEVLSQEPLQAERVNLVTSSPRC